VTGVESGYAGGATENPTYESVCSGLTGHAEVVRVSFDTSVLTLSDILDVFWAIHDPTTIDRQGNDTGSQYKSVIFYEADEQLPVIESSIMRTQELWDDPLVTVVEPLKQFYAAEAYHQDYFAKNPAAGYCQIVINPKLEKLKAKLGTLLT
jgi:peptide-methionine (S)-S-oxide reductase